MVSVALKCSNSEKAIEYMENSFDKWASEIEDLLSQISLEDSEVPHECTEDIPSTRVSFRVPTQIKGPMTKRKKNVLERENKRSTKSTRKRGKTDKYSIIFFFLNGKYSIIFTHTYIHSILTCFISKLLCIRWYKEINK
jgi:hypothetical protein